MSAVCLILKVHEPPRLRHYSFFDIGESTAYTDEAATCAQLDNLTRRCYLPAARLLLKQVRDHHGDFRFAIILSGVTLTLLERFQPELLDQFRDLAQSGHVEFICEPYAHSLAFLFSKPEFREQVQLHRHQLHALLGVTPTTLHCNELHYNNDLAVEADALGFNGLLAGGAEGMLVGRSPHRVYQPAAYPGLKLLFDTPLLADTIARFSSAIPSTEKPLTATKFMSLLAQKPGDVAALSVDLQAFEEQPLGEPGALEFLSEFPAELLAYRGLHFETPAQVACSLPPCGSISIPGFTSWEAAEQDSQELIGNEMQKDAIHGLYLLEKEVKAHPNPSMLVNWRQFQVSDHFRYMGAKQGTEPYDRASTNPYHSPYDAYINFMNILTDFSERLSAR